MKRITLLLTILFCIHGYALVPSKKMMELESICLQLRDGIINGSDREVIQGCARLKAFQSKNAFVEGESALKIVAGSDNLVSTDGHILYIPQYFEAKLHQTDGVFLMGERLKDEWEKLHESASRSTSGYVFRQCNFAMKANTSVVYEIDVPKGPIDIMVIAEPNALVTMKIFDVTNNVYLNKPEDLVDEKEGRASRRRTMRFDSPCRLHLSIYNTSDKDASMALFVF